MPSPYEDSFRPLVAKWLELIEAAWKSKKAFTDIGEQCASFYQARNGFLFEKEFREKYLGVTNENQLPRHRLSFQKAFEYVAVLSPSLLWRHPQRNVKPRKRIDITPEQFGISPEMMQQWQQFQQQMGQFQQALQQYQQMMQQGPPPPPVPQPGQPPVPPMPWPPPPPQPPPPIDPNIQQPMQLWQWGQQQQQQETVAANVRCQLLEEWLNYVPDEIPYGGLTTHSRLAIIDALVKGMGCLWTSPYIFPGSERAIVGSFYDTVDNLLIDPDATSLGDATWIAQRVVAPIHQVEEEFSLTAGSLEGKGGSVVSQQKMAPIGSTTSSGDQRKDKVGRTSELITYYKIWSKCGVGTNLVSHFDPDMKSNLERVSGKFTFLCVCSNLTYPLNLPADQLENMSDEEVAKRLEWPFPSWRDDKWPVSTIQFYPRLNNVWPLAPLAPALGELTFLQVVMSHLADRVVKSSRDFIAVLQSAGAEIEDAIKNGGDLTVLKLTEVHQDIGKVVQFLHQPSVNNDMWQIIDRINRLFEQRTGLTDFLMGQPGTQSRSATDAQIKGNNLSVRPDDMRMRVEEFQRNACVLEKQATRWFIQPADVELLFGKVGSYLWERYITSQPVEAVFRDTDCTIEPGSAARPDEAKDVENINTLAQFVGPILQQVYMQTGNPQPLNWLLQNIADAHKLNLNGFSLPAPPPPQQPQLDPNQQAAQQMELQQKQLELQGQQAKQQGDLQFLQAKGQMDSARFALEMQKLQTELQLKQQEAQVKQIQAQAAVQQTMVNQQVAQNDAQSDAQSTQIKLAGDAAQAQIGQQKATTELELARAKAQQELMIADLKMQQKLQEMAQRQHEKEQKSLFSDDPIQRLFGDKNES